MFISNQYRQNHSTINFKIIFYEFEDHFSGANYTYMRIRKKVGPSIADVSFQVENDLDIINHFL